MSRAEWQGVLHRLGDALARGPLPSETCVPEFLKVLGIHSVEAAGESDLELVRDEQQLAFRLDFSLPDAHAAGLLSDLILALFERSAEQDHLHRTTERMEMLSAASFEGILVHVDGVIIDANQRFAELFGYDHPSELFDRESMPRHVAAEDIPGVLDRLASGAEGEYVITCIRRDGSRFRAEVQSKQGQLGSRPVRVAALRDVTERERTASLLRESEKRFRDLAEHSFDFMTISQDGVIIDAGGAIERVLGLAAPALVNRAVLDLVAPSSRPLAQEIVAERKIGSHEIEMLGADGEAIPVSIVLVNSSLEGEPVRVAGIRDLRPPRRLEAERRKLEQQVERTQRLQSLGVLAGGIAHDFNNLLVGILGNAEYLLERLRDSGDREAAQAIFAAGHRAADLTSQMLAYAGQREIGRREAVDLGALCRELRILLDASLSKKAHVQLRIEPRSIVMGDRATLTQLLMNLLTNASDALENRAGNIAIEMKHVATPDPHWEHALGAAVKPGAWLLLEVKDDGVGMDDATRERAFEPFFSTKPKGHGLGLAACVGIVSAHGGAIRVDSAPGRGSCFSVLLPAAALEVESKPAAPRERWSGAHRTVLIVDDEPLVRSQLRRSLELRGYSVQEAKDGKSALASLEAGAPDVMILDITMPDLDGAEVLRRARESGFRVPIVLSSGYANPGVERRLDPASFQGFLRKPFAVQELIEAIERALGKRA